MIDTLRLALIQWGHEQLNAWCRANVRAVPDEAFEREMCRLEALDVAETREREGRYVPIVTGPE